MKRTAQEGRADSHRLAGRCHSFRTLYAYPVELTGGEPQEDIEDGRHKGPEMYDAIGGCSEKEHAERKA